MNKAILTYDVIQNFSMMFNQVADFPMMTSRIFTFQMLCLMYQIPPRELEKKLMKDIDLT